MCNYNIIDLDKEAKKAVVAKGKEEYIKLAVVLGTNNKFIVPWNQASKGLQLIAIKV